MKIVEQFPHEVVEEPNVWIPMADGTRLAARIWRPRGSEDRPVPAILEYLPYRKRFGTAVRDALTHPYLARHGYACLRVDIRGSGESDGVLTDEYGPQELADGLAVIEWIAAQPWCDGGVGMMGISWGGFNGLQIAALRPPALRAVATLCSTDDRYADDIHHMGGCLLCDNLSWASTMLGINSMPPDPALVGARWREMWLARLEGSGLWLETWLRHQRRDAYWKHGSVCEDFSAIRCPVYAVGGWADGYSNAVFRLLARLEVPRKGLVGPWAHRYPHFATPRPAIGFLQELLRWWDHWLKGRDTGIMDEPMLRVWMQESVPPRTRFPERPGRWVGEPSWPSAGIAPRRMALAPGRLGEEGAAAALPLRSPLGLGAFGGRWLSFGEGPDMPADQRAEDGGALVFDTGPLAEPLEILGAPVAELEIAADRPVAMVAARLSDVRPDGSVTRVTYGLLNLTHRDSHEHPEPLVPGEPYRVRVQLNDIAHAFPAGHRIRLALSSSYWPIAWTPPAPACLTVHTGGSALLLPVRPPRPEDDARLPAFAEPEAAPPLVQTDLAPGRQALDVSHDLATGETVVHQVDDRGRQRIEETGLEVGSAGEEWYRIRGEDPLSATGEARWTKTLGRGDWGVRTVSRTRLSATAEAFLIRAELDAHERDATGERRVFATSWEVSVPRDLV
jgi:putative CocE/NonD family hydrolase